MASFFHFTCMLVKWYMFNFLPANWIFLLSLVVKLIKLFPMKFWVDFKECPSPTIWRKVNFPIGAINSCIANGPWDLICKLPKLVVGTNVRPDQWTHCHHSNGLLGNQAEELLPKWHLLKNFCFTPAKWTWQGKTKAIWRCISYSKMMMFHCHVSFPGGGGGISILRKHL